MRIVLRSDMGGLGKRGDILDVADGYARNFLLPKGHAILASAGVESQANAMRRSRDLRDARDREAAETVARRLVPAGHPRHGPGRLRGQAVRFHHLSRRRRGGGRSDRCRARPAQAATR